MSDISQPEPNGRAANGRFGLGNAGGPGRPKGAVSAAAAALDQAAVETHQELMRVVLDQARSGNLEATRMLWARIWPVRRGRPTAFDVPPIGHVKDVSPAIAAVNEAMFSGEITGQEAQPILKAIGSQHDQLCEDASRSATVRYLELIQDALRGETE
jgi:hypothetical protein